MWFQPATGPLPTQSNTDTKYLNICMSRVGFELTILAFFLAKVFRALDRMTTVNAYASFA
jgi:hypothetical protein